MYTLARRVIPNLTPKQHPFLLSYLPFFPQPVCVYHHYTRIINEVEQVSQKPDGHFPPRWHLSLSIASLRVRSIFR